MVFTKKAGGLISKYNMKPEINKTCIGIEVINGFKLNFLLAINIPTVKCNSMMTAAIELATENPFSPYANKHIGSPKFPVLGKISGLSSKTISRFKIFKIIIPITAKQATNKKVNDPNLKKVLKSRVVDAAKE